MSRLIIYSPEIVALRESIAGVAVVEEPEPEDRKSRISSMFAYFS